MSVAIRTTNLKACQEEMGYRTVLNCCLALKITIKDRLKFRPRLCGVQTLDKLDGTLSFRQTSTYKYKTRYWVLSVANIIYGSQKKLFWFHEKLASVEDVILLNTVYDLIISLYFM